MVDKLEIDLEGEILRAQMEESREALAQKMERLEEKVTETVETATASVAEATATVVETVQNATTSVSETVDSVTNAVQGTVDTVRQSVAGTVDSVKDAFDFSRQMERYPWLMVAGAVGIGYWTAVFLEAAPLAAGDTRISPSPKQGNTSQWFGGMGTTFGPEIAKLQRLAITAVLGSFKQTLIDAVPESIQQPLGKIIDEFSEKIDGR